MSDTPTSGRQLDAREEIDALLATTKTVAVLGMKGPGRGPAYDVPAALHAAGIRIIPVSPKLEEAFGVPAVRHLSEIAEPVDIVDVFRRAEAVPGHVPDILAMPSPPRAVWLQLGIRSEEAARALRTAGIDVVQDRCLKVAYRAYQATTSPGASR